MYVMSTNLIRLLYPLAHIPQFAFVLSKKSLVVGIDNVELIISSTA